MSVGYIARRTVRLYDGPTGQGYQMVLIFGDEVERTGDVAHGRERVFATAYWWESYEQRAADRDAD